MDIDRKALGRRIRSLRGARLWNQGTLAEKTGQNVGTVSAHERGERGLDADQLAAYARVFGVTTDFLLGLSTPHPAQAEAVGR